MSRTQRTGCSSSASKFNLEDETISYIKNLENKIQMQAMRLSSSEQYKHELESIVKIIDEDIEFPLDNNKLQELSEVLKEIFNTKYQFEELKKDLEKVLIQKRKIVMELTHDKEVAFNDLEKLKAEFKQLTTVNDELTSKLRENEIKHEQLNAYNSRSNNALDQLRNEVSKLGNDNQELKGKINFLIKNNELLEKENAEHSSRYRTLTKDHQDLTSRY